MIANNNEQYTAQVVTATTTVKTGQGLLGGIFVSSISGTPTITISDGANTIVSAFTPSAATPYPFPVNFLSSLVITISGTCTATVFYN